MKIHARGAVRTRRWLDADASTSTRIVAGFVFVLVMALVVIALNGGLS